MNMDDLYRLLRAGHVQAQAIVDTVFDPLVVLDENLRVRTANRAFFETFKVDRDATLGHSFPDLGNGQWDIPDLRRLLGEVIPRAAAVINYEVEHDFPTLGRRTMLLSARRLSHPDQSSRSLLLSIVDVTERYRQKAAQDMMVSELRHRTKNLFAVTQALARRTATAGRTAEEYRDEFLARFQALAEAQELTFDAPPSGGRLKALIERILAPYAGSDADAVAIEPGADIDLAPPVLLSLGLVLQELATNAAKHGALSVAGGRVRISWRIEDETGSLRLEWEEEGGPPTSPPVETGYGTQLIQTVTTHGLGGEVAQDYAADGLKTEIVIPLDAPPPRPGADGQRPPLRPPPASRPDGGEAPAPR